MRKHLYLIIDHPDEDMVGKLEILDRRHEAAEKNQAVGVQKLKMDSGDRYTYTVVGLGYLDFDSESDYQENIADRYPEKLAEIDEKHIEAAGLDPQEVLA